MKTLLLLAALPVFAQSPALHLDLTGEWRLIDSMGEKQLGTYRLPRQDTLGPDLIRWLARDVQIPEWADTSRLVLTLGTFADQYEVFVNGQSIGKSDEFRFNDLHMPRSRSFSVPPELVRSGSQAELKIRMWRIRAIGRRYTGLAFTQDHGPYVITYDWNAPPRPAAGDFQQREFAVGAGLLTSMLGLGLAALLLFAWAEQRSRFDLLLLAGYLVSEEFVRCWDALTVYKDWPLAWSQVANLSLSLGMACLTLLAANASGVTGRWLAFVAWLPFLIRGVSTWVRLTHDGIDSVANAYVMTAGYLFTGAIASYGVASRSRQPGGQWRNLWPPALIAMLATFSAFRLASLPAFLIGTYRLQLFQITALGLAAAIAFQLLRQVRIDRARMAGELAAAREIQQLLIASPPVANLYQVEAVYAPAMEVGGDFWQAFPLPTGGQLVAVGDVSGKGLRAAMVVSLLTGALRNRHSDEPAALLAELNRVVAEGLQGGFVIAMVGRFDTDGRVLLAAAGHPAPYLDGTEVELAPGFPLGLDASAGYVETETKLAPGQRMTFVSDGVIEAANAKGELFGFDRTREISGKSAQEIAAAAETWGQNDDITVVTVRRVG
jgi:hypothetical protein